MTSRYDFVVSCLQETSALSRSINHAGDALGSTATSGALPEASLLAKAADLKLLLQQASEMVAGTADSTDADSVHGLEPLAEGPLVQLQINITEQPKQNGNIPLADLEAQLVAVARDREALLQNIRDLETKVMHMCKK